MNKIQIEMESYAAQSCLYDEQSGRADSVDGAGYIENAKEKGFMSTCRYITLKKTRSARSDNIFDIRARRDRAIGYRFRLVPIIVVKNKERGRIADSPKFMTYIAWDRSSRCACSTARYSPESTLNTVLNLITKEKHCAARKHLMWALALPTCGGTTHFRAWHVHLGSQLGTDCCARAASAASATDPFTTDPRALQASSSRCTRQTANITLNSLGKFAQFSRKRSERKLDETHIGGLSNETAAKVNGSSRSMSSERIHHKVSRRVVGRDEVSRGARVRGSSIVACSGRGQVTWRRPPDAARPDALI
ncbi:hypothetical protein RR48_09373 [Papilio machaon]|uniref:Uncharacterized protein n=1 Tax=Papilio machaon TaxID=76193 RepID=A0A194RD97_PAPMA|nr:hypothetical protein RR48_09373 [Papilio machaon]